jgi:hypothetical protein
MADRSVPEVIGVGDLDDSAYGLHEPEELLILLQNAAMVPGDRAMRVGSYRYDRGG